MSTNWMANDIRRIVWVWRKARSIRPVIPDVQGWRYSRLWRLRHRLIRWWYGWTFHRWLTETTPDGRIWRRSLL